MLQQPNLTPLRTQLDAEAPCEEAREGLLTLALPAMDAALRRAPDALADPDVTNESVIRVRPRPGGTVRYPGGRTGPLSCSSAAAGAL